MTKERGEIVFGEGALGKKSGRQPGASAGPPRLLFAQVREDAAVEAGLLREVDGPARLFAIGSGGCTAFSLLAAKPEAALYAVDINPAQIYLMELSAPPSSRSPRMK